MELRVPKDLWQIDVKICIDMQICAEFVRKKYAVSPQKFADTDKKFLLYGISKFLLKNNTKYFKLKFF